MIRVVQLRKSYGSVVAVDGISFEIAPRETFGLLGPNGAGKTTTIHMIVGLLKADSGEIHINGGSDPTRRDVRRSLGIAPQALSAYDDLTARENLVFIARLYGLHGRRMRSQVAAALERAGLADRADELVKTFSGGMKRRLHIACALVHAPAVLILDEPTIGIDPQARNHILEDVERLKEQGCTILLTTHYMEEAQRLCDRVAIMDQGRILVMDTVTNLLERYGGKALVRAELDRLPADRSVLPGRLEGTTLLLESERPFEAVQDLMAAGTAIRTVSIERPSLESVFLKLTGRSLRD